MLTRFPNDSHPTFLHGTQYITSLQFQLKYISKMQRSGICDHRSPFVESAPRDKSSVLSVCPWKPRLFHSSIIKHKLISPLSFEKMNAVSRHCFDQLVAPFFINTREHSSSSNLQKLLQHSKSSKYKIEARCALFQNNTPEHF